MCHASVQSLLTTHPNLRCTCPRKDSIPNCTDSRSPGRASGGGGSRGSSKKGLSLENQIGLTLMQGVLEGILSSALSPPPAAPEAPPPPPEPQFVPNPVYEGALKKFSELSKPDSELRLALVEQLSGVPAHNLPPKDIALPAQLLLSACIGQQARLSSSRPGADDQTELLLRQSADALWGGYTAAAMQGCDAPEPPMPSQAAADKRRKAAELAADLFAKAGELSVHAAQSGERAQRAEAALKEAEKTLAAPADDQSLLQAAREQEAAARRELEAAREEAARLKKEAEEAAKKGRTVTDRLDDAGGDEKKLDDLFKEFGDGR